MPERRNGRTGASGGASSSYHCRNAPTANRSPRHETRGPDDGSDASFIGCAGELSGSGIRAGVVSRALQVSRAVVEGGFDFHAEIARGLVDRGAELLTVFQCGSMDSARERAFPGRILCLDANRRRRFKRLPWFALKLWRETVRGSVDLAICHHLPAARAVDWLMRTGRVRRPYLVVHHYNYFDPTDNEGRERGRFLHAALSRGWRVIGVSRAICDNIRETVPPASAAACLTIHNAIDVDALERGLVNRQRARETLKLPLDAFVFGTIGRLVPFKAHDELLEAFAGVQERMPGSRLIVIGRGPLEEQLRRRVTELGLQGKAMIYGFLDQAAHYLRAFDVFVLPSHHEPFGLVLPEAMTARVPIIASDSGASLEIVPPEAAIFPTGNQQALADALLALFRASPEARARWAEAGYRRVQSAFRIADFQRAYGDLLAFAPEP